ncbi:hypothetical protein [Acinetobacter sp. TTH0-4]|uniref:hypothetical protein n=1 Tax=Acinetobacter sp. TTH0-4 TaxID=1646498 RepID=UPI0012DDBA05|nr:hypothetical protein [Acinetobacter sp. TTH0-4]
MKFLESDPMQCDSFVNNQGWRDIPEFIISREGKSINLTEDSWYLPYSLRKSTIDFTDIEPVEIKWVLKKFVIDQLERVSIHSGLTSFIEVKNLILRTDVFLKRDESIEIMDSLILAFEKAINTARSEHNLWYLYRPIQWYLYGAEYYPELGFSTAYASILETLSIPGNPKGEAVRMEDPDSGPLNHSLELPLLIKALKADHSKDFKHLQEKAAVALSIAYGRNPANLTFLRHLDLVNLTEGSDDPVYVLRMPRIKKRLVNPRDDFVEVFIDSTFGDYVHDLIKANDEANVILYHEGTRISNPKPIFINIEGNRAAL